MSVRLVVTMHARPGKGAEFLKAFQSRCQEVQQEPGCLQFEMFQSGSDPDKLVLLELWEDQAALDKHAEVNRTRPPLAADLRGEGPGEREDYEYSRTR
jgi:quinol monooxygenase YgiN